jgi:hypothetical protein
MQVLKEIFFIICYLFSITFGLVNRNKPKLVSMTTKKENRGGPRPNSGRPPKILEIKLIEQMDALAVPEQIWNALLYKCQQGDTNAIKLWLSYRFGLPKQQIDITSNGEKIAPPIQWIGRNIAIEQAKVVSEDHQDSDHQEGDVL